MTSGMQAVVAMGYSVTVSAAKLMMKPIYSGSRWREAHTEDCNAYPVRHLLYFIQSGTAIIKHFYLLQRRDTPP